MTWKLKDCNTAMIITKREGNLHYEISPHYQFKLLVLETVDERRGLREGLKDYSVLELKNMFKDEFTKEQLRLLYAWEKYTIERHERKELDNYLRGELLKARKELTEKNKEIEQLEQDLKQLRS